MSIFVLCVGMGLMWTMGYSTIESETMKRGFLLLYEPLRYASRYLILSPYLSPSPNFLPLTLSSDIFFAVFYCTVMRSEMESWNVYLGAFVHVVGVLARSLEVGDRAELLISKIAHRRRESRRRSSVHPETLEADGGASNTVTFSPILGGLFKKSMEFHEVKRNCDERRLSGDGDIESGTHGGEDGANRGEGDCDDNDADNNAVTLPAAPLPADPPPANPPPKALLNYFAISFSCHKQRYYYLILDLLLSECIDLWSRISRARASPQPPCLR
ncbi:hypothetical protein TrRE_jg6426 [Triparma retinervis]|uniref:Uncharacterized protein n=1 Tax=Triparma retinervis TaxID=2557542 RepID=A0A9W7ADJ5_9STRA|nr:hypothetical protein TrRE_jg6426 [Triparma retinervis]